MTEENDFDVIVVGAGISGIGSAYRLQKECPDRSFVLLEGRPNLGGTWDLFRYPGVRSDSDMHTLGVSFKPWKAAKSVADGPAILEYLEEVYPTPSLIGAAPMERAEVRRLVSWFGDKFGREVSDFIHTEKFVKRFLTKAEPDSRAVRAGLANIRTHLDYIAYLTDRRNWLAGDEFSLADIMAGAHLSAIDYMGDVPWSRHEAAKEWYARIKSRPSFRSLLEDYIPGFPPPKHYANLDF